LATSKQAAVTPASSGQLRRARTGQDRKSDRWTSLPLQPERGWAQDVDRHVGARLRELRVAAGLSQQGLADLIGVTYQQAHKCETGVNRLAGPRLFAPAAVLGCDVGEFFAGLEIPVAECSAEPADQRRLVDLARHYRRIAVPRHKRSTSRPSPG
jgi:transcriptional regulator with XRE-family HTH domain